MKISIAAVSLLSASATAFTSKGPSIFRRTRVSSSSTDVEEDTTTTSKSLHDPMGLYPENSPERKAGLIEPLENEVEPDPTYLDPLGLYMDTGDDQSNKKLAEPSPSLPFLARPALLDGSMAGDRGFDPFGFAKSPEALLKYRNSELKHARLAMLAAVGWPLAELFHNDIASAWNMPDALNMNDRVPSVLNGGLGNVPPVFWIVALTAASLVEAFSGEVGEIQSPNLGFDPLGFLSSQKGAARNRYLEESELFNGRLAMLAITGYAIQEWWTGNSVVDAVPIFFKPINVVIEQLLSSGAATSV